VQSANYNFVDLMTLPWSAYKTIILCYWLQ